MTCQSHLLADFFFFLHNFYKIRSDTLNFLQVIIATKENDFKWRARECKSHQMNHWLQLCCIYQMCWKTLQHVIWFIPSYLNLRFINPLSPKYLAKMAVKFSIVEVVLLSPSHSYDLMTWETGQLYMFGGQSLDPPMCL